MAEQHDKRLRGSSGTKLRILQAARRRFSMDGYERTTIRAVAADAEIDPSMVMRYFGSKERLFAEAAFFDLQLPDLSSIPRDKRGQRLAQHYVRLWGHDEASGGGLAILLRTAATTEAAAERVRDIFKKQVLPRIAAVSPDKPSIRAGLIASQLLGMAYCRYIVRMPALTALREEVVVANLGRTIQHYLHGPIED